MFIESEIQESLSKKSIFQWRTVLKEYVEIIKNIHGW